MGRACPPGCAAAWTCRSRKGQAVPQSPRRRSKEPPRPTRAVDGPCVAAHPPGRLRLQRSCQAATRSCTASKVGRRPLKACLARTEGSISAMFSQLPWTGCGEFPTSERVATPLVARTPRKRKPENGCCDGPSPAPPCLLGDCEPRAGRA